jgi:competence protein ComGC
MGEYSSFFAHGCQVRVEIVHSARFSYILRQNDSITSLEDLSFRRQMRDGRGFYNMDLPL